MKSISFIASFLVFALAFVATSSAFAPKSTVSPTFATARAQKVQIQMVFNDEPERKALTRDSEPEEYFQTNTDKMSDSEKLPIALAGVAAICVPFFAGLIALYAAK